jgi:hypothetical protein
VKQFDRAPADEVRLAQSPPLLVLAVAASFAALWINRVMLLVLDGRIPNTDLILLSRWGQFATNLAVIASLVALLGALIELEPDDRAASLWRRIVIASLTGIVVFTVARAAFFPRERTTAAILWISIGAAYILAIFFAIDAARWARSIDARVTTAAAASMACLALGALVIDRYSYYQPSRWQGIAVYQLQRAGEVGYLVAILSASAFAIPRGRGRRERFALALAAVTFATIGSALCWALLHLRGDFTLTLQYALRVSWLIDQLPSVYLIVLCAGWSAAAGALLSADPTKRSAALGIILLICSGYAPRSPDRLLMHVLAILLLARAVERTRLQITKPSQPPSNPTS